MDSIYVLMGSQTFEISKKVKFSQFWSHDPPIPEKIGDFLAFFAKISKNIRKK